LISRLLRNKWFVFGLSIKIIFLFFGGSEYLERLFIPFLDSAIQNLGANPWSLLPAHYFPYGSVLFFILFVPKWILSNIFGEAALGLNALSFFSVKIVLLFFDVALFGILARWIPQRENKLILYYWLNPVLFYISYIHGQLDVASMFFAIAAILFLIRSRIFFAAILFSASILCKFHTIIILPLMLAYLWSTTFRKEGVKSIGAFVLIVFSLVGVGFLPQILAHNMGYISVGSPEAMTIFGTKLQVDSERFLYIGFLLTAGILARLCMSTRITGEGLFYGSGVIFGTLLLGTSAMPGWYFWFLPFVAVFYSTRGLVFHSLLFVFICLYFFHFGLIDFYPVSYKAILNSGGFSLLQLSTFGLVAAMWVGTIRFEAPLVRRTRPLLIGLAGNSGSGKNSITEVIRDLFGKSATTVVEGDDYHKWERGHSRWQDYTHLNPKANFLDEMADHTRALMTGKLVYQPHYDHSTGKFTLPRPIETTKNLIVQGLHTFYLVNLRTQFDIKIFMAPDEDLRTAWKVLRDVNQRGHTLDKVISSIRSRDMDSLVHINPQRELADWTVEYKLRGKGGFDFANLRESPEFYVRHIVWNDSPISRLVENLCQYDGAKAAVELNPQNIDQVMVSFEGALTKEQVADIASASFEHIRHLTRSNTAPVWHANQEGFIQLIALALIERQIFMKGFA